MITRRPLGLSLLFASALAGCDEKIVDLPDDTETLEASVQVRHDAATSVMAGCDQALDGTPCGDGGDVMHCLYNACVLNVCGDGIKAGDEVCDDGNQQDGDSCNSQCKDAMCGNGLVDIREQCDDGNSSDDDGCDSMCRIIPDGGKPARADAGQDAGPDAGVTDSGTTTGGGMDSGGGTAMDTGTPTMDTGVADTGTPDTGAADSGPKVDAGPTACEQCVVSNVACKDFNFTGPDNPAECFGGVVPSTVTNPDPKWSDHCVSAFRCAITSPDHCGNDPAGIVACFCGATPIDVCFLPGAVNEPKGSCITEIYAATGCTPPDKTCVNTNLDLSGIPLFAARALALCSRETDTIASPIACGPVCYPAP